MECEKVIDLCGLLSHKYKQSTYQTITDVMEQEKELFMQRQSLGKSNTFYLSALGRVSENYRVLGYGKNKN